jgi:small ligand-binding sensory domain FIST
MKRIDNVEEKLSDLIAENKILKKMIHNLSPDTKEMVNSSIELAIERDKINRKGLLKAYEVSP